MRQSYIPFLLLLTFIPRVSPAQDAGSGNEPTPELGSTDASEPSTTGIADGALGQYLDNAIGRLARQKNEQGLALLAANNLPDALEAFKQAYALSPNDPEIVNNLGYLFLRLGDRTSAESLIRHALELTPDRIAALVNLADLLIAYGTSDDEYAQAAEAMRRARELRGNDARVILRQARIAAKRVQLTRAEQYYRELLLHRHADDALRIELGDFYRDWGHVDQALSWYRRVSAKDTLGNTASQRINDIEVTKAAGQYGWSGSDPRITGQLRKQLERARRLLVNGELDATTRILKKITKTAPDFAEAHAVLGEVWQQKKQPRDAELSLLRAAALRPGDAQALVLLGRLYLHDLGRGSEAAVYIRRAVDLRPDWSELRFDLARAQRSAGNLKSALHQINHYLANANAKKQTEALQLKHEIQNLFSKTTSARNNTVAIDRTHTGLAARLGRARAYLVQGNPVAAMAELRRIPKSERGADVVGFQAQILQSVGRYADAIALLRQAIWKNPRHAELHEQIALLLAQHGDREGAKRYLRRAQALGNVAATYHLARLELGNPPSVFLLGDVLRVFSLYRARALLTEYRERAAGSAVHMAEAKTLATSIARRLYRLGAALLALLLGVIAIVWVIRRRTGRRITLRALATAHPESIMQIQPALSAIRHEVLKHNTMVLRGLIDALQQGQPATDKAQLLARNLFGNVERTQRGTSNAVAGGHRDEETVIARFERHMADLKRVAASYDRQLLPQGDDSVLASISDGFSLLADVVSDLRQVDRLSSRRREHLLQQLRAAEALLNDHGYKGIDELLTTFTQPLISAEILQTVFDQIRYEPHFSNTPIARPVFECGENALPAAIKMPRRAFEDVMGNLCRNAIQASVSAAITPVALGVCAEVEVDVITGLRHMVFGIRDRAPGELTEAMVRQADIKRGLGLSRDLAAQHGGSISVTSGPPPWTKTVSIHLPAADGACDDD